MTARAYCQLCEPPRLVENETLFEHFRIVHDLVPEVETWPDGDWVIYDDTLEPADFEEPT